MGMQSRVPVVEFVNSLYAGGTERQALAVASGLDRRVFDVRICCLNRGGEFLPEAEARGISVEEYPIRRLFDAHSIASRVRLGRRLRAEGVKILHAWCFYGNLFAIPAARAAGIPVVIGSVRDMGAPLWRPAQLRANRWVCRMADRVVTNADAIRRRLIDEGMCADKLEVVRNGIDVARFDRVRADARLHEQYGFPPGAPVVTVVGRIGRGAEYKGIEPFLEAAAMVSRTRPDARFLLVGDGEGRGELEARSCALGLSGRAVFTGFRADVESVLACSTISVLPSLTEGLSNSLLESMSAGLAVVATDVGGTIEAVEHDVSGLIVPPGDPRPLAEAMGRLLDDPAMRARLGAGARRRAHTHFSLQRMVADTERLYMRLCARRAGGRSILPFADRAPYGDRRA
jgi:glycosyltransferase involved in cell wall biosynthesis